MSDARKILLMEPDRAYRDWLTAALLTARSDVMVVPASSPITGAMLARRVRDLGVIVTDLSGMDQRRRDGYVARLRERKRRGVYIPVVAWTHTDPAMERFVLESGIDALFPKSGTPDDKYARQLVREIGHLVDDPRLYRERAFIANPLTVVTPPKRGDPGRPYGEQRHNYHLF